MELHEAKIPTMYFIGVSTGQSSSKNIFPEWAKTLKIAPARLIGIDLKIHDNPENYQKVIRFIKNDPLSLGALVTTHKMDLMRACREEFDEIDPLAFELGEVSSVYKRRGNYLLELQTLSVVAWHWKTLPPNYFSKFDSNDDSGRWRKCPSISLVFLQVRKLMDKIYVVNRVKVDWITCMTRRRWGSSQIIPLVAHDSSVADKVIHSMNPGSLVVNATGLERMLRVLLLQMGSIS